MMNMNITHRDRRVAIVGVVVVGGTLLSSRVFPAVRARETARRREADATATQLSIGAIAVRQLPAIRDSLAARQASLTALESTMLAADSPAEAGGELVAAVEMLADSARVRVTGVQLRSDTVAVLGMSRIGLRLTGVADVVGLGMLLQSIEGDADTPMAIRELSVVQSDPTAAAGKIESLRIDLLIEALCFIRPPSPR
jgi:hypothetical protein